MSDRRVPQEADDFSKPTEGIRTVANLTGLSLEVLRAWERRYGFPLPTRVADSNRRLYSMRDVERLLALKKALDSGFRIGDIVDKPMAELRELIAGLSKAPGVEESTVSSVSVQAFEITPQQLLELLVKEDLNTLEQRLALAGQALGAKRFVTELADPFAVAIGEAWSTGDISVRHEHMAVECLTTRMRQMLSEVPNADGRPLILLATLPGELHSLGIQFVALYLSSSTAKTRLLGTSTPVAEIVDAVQTLGADIIGLTVTKSSDLAMTLRMLRLLERLLPEGVDLWIGGDGAPALEGALKRAQILTTWGAIDEALLKKMTELSIQ